MIELDFRHYKNVFKDKAFLAENSRGRRWPKNKDRASHYYEVLDPWRFDVKQILDSKFLRRLDNKTQVFSTSGNIYVRTRGSHTREVASNACAMAEVLGLNLSLTEAIAWGHDLGHTPYGHLGERTLSELIGKNFRHEIMSVIVAQKIERDGMGLNLTFETLEGILNHSRGSGELVVDGTLPLEYSIVMFSDKISYLFADLSDANRLGALVSAPKKLIKFFGEEPQHQIDFCCLELLKESVGQGFVSFNYSEAARKFKELKAFMYSHLYYRLDLEEDRQQLAVDLRQTYDFLQQLRHEKLINIDPALILAIMTDNEAAVMAKMARENDIKSLESMKSLSFFESIRNLKNEINLFDPDLGWGERKQST